MKIELVMTWDVYVDDHGLDQLSPVVAGGGQQPPLVLWQEIVGEQDTRAPVMTEKGKRWPVNIGYSRVQDWDKGVAWKNKKRTISSQVNGQLICHPGKSIVWTKLAMVWAKAALSGQKSTSLSIY